MSAGREVVEDYSSLQLSLRGHPVRFLRARLDAMRIVRCSDLASIRDGRNVEVAGVILVRQRPGSAKGVLFGTIEDETGIANGILWPDRFETYRRQVMSSSMIAMRGRLQKESEIIHIICDRITVKASGIVVDFITPETETTHWYFWRLARGFAVDDGALTDIIREGQRKIFAEDMTMLLRQQDNLDRYPDRKLLLLNIAAGGVRSRR